VISFECINFRQYWSDIYCNSHSTNPILSTILPS